MARINVSQITDAQGNPVSSRNITNQNQNRAINLFFQRRDNSQAYYAQAGEIKGALIPENGKQNLIQKADWAVNPSALKSGRNNVLTESIVPLHIREFQPRFSSVVNNVLFLNNQFQQLTESLTRADVNGDGRRSVGELLDVYNSNPIANSFQAFRTGFEYTFPYLQLQEQVFKTQFGDGDTGKPNIFDEVTRFARERVINDSSVGISGLYKLGITAGSLGPLVRSIGTALVPAVNPAEARDKYYTASHPVSYTLTIDLLNNVNWETANYHKELVELWSHQMGMGNLRNPYVGDSPCIYTVEIPNIRWCPAAHIDFSYVGNGNLIYIDGIPFPESYTCTFEINEIFPPLRSIFHAYVKNSEKFHAISTDTNV